jgi:hypothetical protein
MIDEVRFSPMLNRRHKTALCATLVCVGLILLLGGGVRAAVGIGLLGIAFSWAFGSNYRLVHWLFVVFGLLLLIPAIGDGLFWPRNKPEVIKNQTSIIEGDRDMIKNDMSLIAEETDKQEQRKEREDLNKQSDELFKDQQELRRLQDEGIFRHIVKNDWGTIVGGLLLLSAGLGLVVGVKPVQHNPRGSPQ